MLLNSMLGLGNKHFPFPIRSQTHGDRFVIEMKINHSNRWNCWEYMEMEKPSFKNTDGKYNQFSRGYNS